MKGEWTVEDAADGGGEYRGVLQDGRRIFVDGKPLLFRTPEHAQSVVDAHNATLRAEVERLKGENAHIETQAHGIDESLSLLSQQYKSLEAENERLTAELDASVKARDKVWIRHATDIWGEGVERFVNPMLVLTNRVAREDLDAGLTEDYPVDEERNDAARKAAEEPLPTIDQMAGSDPNFTGEEVWEGQEITVQTAHFGDPCVYCGTPHDEAQPGPCPARKAGEDENERYSVD